MADKLPYHGTTLAHFGDARDVTLGCGCGDCWDCDCTRRPKGDEEIRFQ